MTEVQSDPGVEHSSYGAHVLTDADAAPELAFSPREYAHRLERVRAVMERDGVDLLFLQSPEAMCYLSGYSAAWYQVDGPFGPISAVAVHVDRDDLILFDADYHGILARYTTVAKDIRLHECFGPDFYEFVARELKASGWTSGVAGLEMGTYRPNRLNSDRCQQELEAVGCTVVDATHIVRECRSVKSEQELACIDTAAQIADIGLRAAAEYLEPGVTEIELWGAATAAMARAGGENQAIPMLVTSGVKQVSGHSLASRKQIMPGEVVFVDVCGVFNRYHVDQARCLSIGEPHPDVVARLNGAVGVFAEISKILRPGLLVSEFNEFVREYYEDRLGVKPGDYDAGGYELGLSFPPEWVGTYTYGGPTVSREDEAFLPGTVVNHESQFFLPHLAGYATVIDTIVVRESDARLVSNVPHELMVV